MFYWDIVQSQVCTTLLHSTVTPALTKIVISNCLSLNQGFVLFYFSFIQFECCGSAGPIDWAYASYNGYQDITKEIGIGATATALPFRIPSSCCRWGDDLIKTERSWRSDYFTDLMMMMICQLDCIKCLGWAGLVWTGGPQAKLYVSNWIKKVEAWAESESDTE